VTTIVIAEDEAIIRLDLREMLEEEGYTVVGEAGRGDQAVSLVCSLKPDLVILDVKMPGMDGIEAARRITEASASAVLMLTAFSQREVIEQARDAGALAYLVKPFQKTDLVPAIELAIARYAETRALMAEVGELTERLEMRKLIDRAKGRLIDAYGMKEADAFSFIQKSAMAARTSMRAVAESVLKGDTVPTP
jgi:AmiR/NasT family two-component response regulator